jgi:mono/diheme cytochrome c family protein
MMKNYSTYLLVLLLLVGALVASISGCPQSTEQEQDVTPPPATGSQAGNGAAEMPDTAAEPETPVEPETAEPEDEAEPDGEAETDGGAEPEDGTEPAAEGEAEVPAGGVDGLAVYKRENCATCHGGDMAGTPMAPPLSNLSDYWNADTLAEYMRDPEGYSATDPRLAEQNQQYSMQMPPFEGSDEELAAMVAWLLAGSPEE